MVSDSPSEFWLDRFLPIEAKPYTRLMRLDRPVGIWLLLLPCLWSVALAGKDFPDIGLFILFAIGAVAMRGAGCVINDLWDRRLDRQVERTRHRPLASGQVSVTQALVLLSFLLAMGFMVLLCLNRATVILGLSSMALVVVYPLMKRVTWWPQLFLGLTFNWGALMGWCAVRGSVEWSAISLYIAGIFWTLAYDTIYACQDVADDEKAGIKSTALLFGKNVRKWVSLFYALAGAFFAFACMLAGLGRGYAWIGAMVLVLTVFHLTQWKPGDEGDCLKRFKANRDIGLLALLAIVAGKLF